MEWCFLLWHYLISTRSCTDATNGMICKPNFGKFAKHQLNFLKPLIFDTDADAFKVLFELVFVESIVHTMKLPLHLKHKCKRNTPKLHPNALKRTCNPVLLQQVKKRVSSTIECLTKLLRFSLKLFWNEYFRVLLLSFVTPTWDPCNRFSVRVSLCAQALLVYN